MNEREGKLYSKYLKTLEQHNVNWIDRIRYWNFLREDYQVCYEDTIKKQNKIDELKKELSAQKIKNQILEQELEMLKTKKGKKKSEK